MELTIGCLYTLYDDDEIDYRYAGKETGGKHCFLAIERETGLIIACQNFLLADDPHSLAKIKQVVDSGELEAYIVSPEFDKRKYESDRYDEIIRHSEPYLFSRRRIDNLLQRVNDLEDKVTEFQQLVDELGGE